MLLQGLEKELEIGNFTALPQGQFRVMKAPGQIPAQILVQSSGQNIGRKGACKPPNGQIRTFAQSIYPFGHPQKYTALTRDRGTTMHHPKFLVILRFKLTQNNMSDIASKVRSIIVDKLGVDENEVTPEASFTNDLGADSLDTVELIMEFEKEFNLSIPDDQAENIQTVGQAITYLEANAK